MDSHGCVSLPHRPPFCLTDGSCDCNHPSYCQRQKKGKEGEITHAISLSPTPSCPTNKPPHCVVPTHRPQSLRVVCACASAFACAHAYMIYRENMRGCASLAVCACPLCCMISHWSVHGGAADTSDPAADQKHQRLVPLWPARGGLISTRLCSVDRKNKRGETGSGGGGGMRGGRIRRNTETGRRSVDERAHKEASVEHMTRIQKIF